MILFEGKFIPVEDSLDVFRCARGENALGVGVSGVRKSTSFHEGLLDPCAEVDQSALASYCGRLGGLPGCVLSGGTMSA